MARLRHGIVLVIFILALVGCGADSREGPQRFSASAENELRDARLAVQDYCRRVGLYVRGKGSSPTAADLQRPIDALDRVVALARDRPTATDSRGERASEVLGDIAEDLEALDCSPDLEQRIERALDTLPQP